MIRRFPIAPRALVVALAFAGGATASWRPAHAADHVVNQLGQKFVPAALKVQAGDQVVFVNDDIRTHNVFSETAGSAFDLKAQRPGARSTVTLAKKGRVDVRCAIHPAMQMTIDVE